MHLKSLFLKVTFWKPYGRQRVNKKLIVKIYELSNPVAIYLIKVNNGNTKTSCEIC